MSACTVRPSFVKNAVSHERSAWPPGRILARYEDLFARMTQRIESWSDELPVFKVRSDKVDQPISIAERPRRRVRKIVGAAPVLTRIKDELRVCRGQF